MIYDYLWGFSFFITLISLAFNGLCAWFFIISLWRAGRPFKFSFFSFRDQFRLADAYNSLVKETRGRESLLSGLLKLSFYTSFIFFFLTFILAAFEK